MLLMMPAFSGYFFASLVVMVSIRLRSDALSFMMWHQQNQNINYLMFLFNQLLTQSFLIIQCPSQLFKYYKYTSIVKIVQISFFLIKLTYQLFTHICVKQKYISYLYIVKGQSDIKVKNMMQKYFKIGKDFISKKIEEYDATLNSQIDYVNQQIPNRLRQPLSVIQQGQIDIESTVAYDNYFKGYPNHHISHFLLDKFNMMVEAQAQPSQYIVPGNQQYHVPPFDSDFQKKALLFRQAIEEYDEGYSKTDEPIICICVINFHHKRGTQIQYRYPQNKTVSDLQSMVIHHAMPDSSHNKHQDYNFFNFEAELKGKKKMLFGVSYFKQIKLTEALKKLDPQFTRSYLQKAVTILSTVPLFGYLKVKLCITTKVFFEKFTEFGIIEQAYKQLNKHFIDSWPNVPITDLYIGSDLKVILSLFSVQDFYEVWKAVLYQKRVVIYAHSSSSASSFILSLLSLFPGLSTFGVFSKPIAKYMQSLRQLALPLRLFSSDNFLSISFHIQDFWQLDKFKKSNKGNFLIATTNRLLKENNDYGIQLFVNLEDCSIERRKSRRPWEGLSKKQKKFLVQLEQMVKKQKNMGYGGSQDCIRNHFHNFLKGALIQITKGIKDFEDFVGNCEKYQNSKKQQIKSEEKKAQQQKSKDSPPLFPESTKKMIFTELLLNKSFAYFRQFKNDKLPQIVAGNILPSLYINNYDYFLRLNSQDFISYNWIDKKLTYGKGQNSKNFSGKQLRFKPQKSEQGKDLLKSIFVGIMANGKFNKSGFYFNQLEHYDGQYLNGIKEGYGKLLVGNEKYIGDFHEGLYEGQGQLVIGNDIYVGEFKGGEKNGYGSMQGKTNFEGRWQNNQPRQSREEIEAKNKKETNEQQKVKQSKDQQKNSSTIEQKKQTIESSSQKEKENEIKQKNEDEIEKQIEKQKLEQQPNAQIQKQEGEQQPQDQNL